MARHTSYGRDCGPEVSFIPFTQFAKTVLNLKLSEGQRTYCKVAFDGIDPIDLEGKEKEVALTIFGGVERIPPESRRQFVLRFGRTSGKSLLCAAYGIYQLMTADLSGCGPGDKAAVVVISFRLEEAGIILNIARALVNESPRLRSTLVQTLGDRFVLQRYDGRRVTFKTAPKSQGGAAARGLSLILLILDESEFVGTRTTGTAVLTDTNVISGAMPRVIDSGALILASTPWPATSETSRLFDLNYANPKTALCALAPTLAIRGDVPEVVARVARERIRDARNALREYDCIIADAEGLFFEQSTIEAAAQTPIVARRMKATAGIDLAFRGDSSAEVIIERQDEKVVVVFMNVLAPRSDRPLVPSEVMAQFAKDAAEYNCREIAADVHYLETAREIAAKQGLQVVSGPAGPGIVKMFLYMRTLLREGKLILPNDQRLLGQLKSVQSSALPAGGISIALPRVQGSGHCDLVSALLAAISHDLRYGRLTTEDLKAPLTAGKLQAGTPYIQQVQGFQKW